VGDLHENVNIPQAEKFQNKRGTPGLRKFISNAQIPRSARAHRLTRDSRR